MSLSADERVVLQRARDEFAVFFRLIKILDKDKKKMVRPTLRDEQRELVDGYLLVHNRVLVGKPRQIGATTVVVAYFLWKAYFSREPLQWLVCSLKDTSVKKLIRRAQTMLASLPLFMRRELEICNDHEIQFADTGASLYGYAAGSRGGGRSDVAEGALLTEFAFYPNQESFLTSLDATVGDFGQIIIETTANTPGDTYHEMVMTAAQGRGEYQLCFFPWTNHSRYRIQDELIPRGFELTDEERELRLDKGQAAWRRQKIGHLGSVTKFRQEYPLTPEDAFIDDSVTYFPSALMKRLVSIPGCEPGKTHVFRDYTPGTTYGVISDVAAGVRKDYSTILVIDHLGRACALWWDNVTRPRELAKKIAAIYDEWKAHSVLCESNNYGNVVVDRLDEWGVRQWRDDGGKVWVTTEASKLYAYNRLESLWAADIMTRLPGPMVAQLHSLVLPTSKTGKIKTCPEAPPALHDDLAVTAALAAVLQKDLAKAHKQKEEDQRGARTSVRSFEKWLEANGLLQSFKGYLQWKK